MKLARFRDPRGRPGFGVVDAGRVHDLTTEAGTFETLLEASDVRGLVSRSDTSFDLGDVVLAPPVGTHPKIFCVGYNYATHAGEMDREIPSHPTLFTRFVDSLVGSSEPVHRPPESVELDWEGEVAVVIGRTGRRIPREHAEQHIVGFTAIADNSVREWQFHTTQATAGKNWESSGSCGPWLVTADEAGYGPFSLTTRVNGDVVQHDHTGSLTFDFSHLIAYISTFTTLRPGDVIATGTPPGIGLRHDPPRFLGAGDVVEVDIPRVGTLRNPVVDEHTDVDAAGATLSAGAR